MHLSEEATNEFEILWNKYHPGQEISRQDLITLAQCVYQAVALVYKPIPNEDLDIFRKIQEGKF